MRATGSHATAHTPPGTDALRFRFCSALHIPFVISVIVATEALGTNVLTEPSTRTSDFPFGAAARQRYTSARRRPACRLATGKSSARGPLVGPGKYVSDNELLPGKRQTSQETVSQVICVAT